MLRLGALFILFVGLIQEPALERDEFRRLHRELQPAAQDWQRIPWQVDLMEARRQAKKSGRALFMWSMNGHPLGCT